MPCDYFSDKPHKSDYQGKSGNLAQRSAHGTHKQLHMAGYLFGNNAHGVALAKASLTMANGVAPVTALMYDMRDSMGSGQLFGHEPGRR